MALVIFLDEMTWFLLPNFVARFAYEISWFLAAVRCPCEMCRVWLHSFQMIYPDESSFFLAVMRSSFLAVMRVQDGVLDVAWLCVCKLGSLLAGK